MPSRPQIYQLMVRHFGNTNETRKLDGTITENGCGKFNDINAAALASIKALGITHIWLTGVLEQASSTAYPNRPADDSALLKGKAGSPYAIRDYFDVCPDYASDPDKRLDEFRDLLDRMKLHGLKAIIDFVPNHIARSYNSDIRPELTFGNNDDTTKFFTPDNNFYYLGPLHPGGGPPLKLPTNDSQSPYALESNFGRVTGNNAITWAPSAHDWYETIKLNYGCDFTLGPPLDELHPLPDEHAELHDTPDTWQKMDAILSYWQNMGVNGFRVDMAHMIPMAYWKWQIRRCRDHDNSAFFMAEAYNTDPSKLTHGNVLDDLLASGFNAVYDGETYDTLKHTVEGHQWANDIDSTANPFSPHFHSVVRYAENHDEVRLASKNNWASAGMDIGRPVSATLFGLGRGPIMLYSGQETGEPADGAEGFSGDDGRTSIFDYGSLPSLIPWINHHRYDGANLTPKQKNLRAFYARLLKLCSLPAFTHGDFYGLNHANQGNPDFGRLDGEPSSGRWLYAFLRRDPSTLQAFLVITTLHPTETLHNVYIQIPEDSLAWLGSKYQHSKKLQFTDQLATSFHTKLTTKDLWKTGLPLGDIPPHQAMYLEIK